MPIKIVTFLAAAVLIAGGAFVFAVAFEHTVVPAVARELSTLQVSFQNSKAHKKEMLDLLEERERQTRMLARRQTGPQYIYAEGALPHRGRYLT